MKNHVKIYMEANGYDIGDWIPCEKCGAESIDIHHILPKGRGGKDEAENLIGLCRNCHTLAHENNNYLNN